MCIWREYVNKGKKDCKKIMKKYVIITEMDLNDPNRGTAALGYGAVSFLKQEGFLNNNHILLKIPTPIKFWKHNDSLITTKIQGSEYRIKTCYIFKPFFDLYIKFGILLPFTKLSRIIKEIDLVAAINGGDGFSDIYNSSTFYWRLRETWMANRANIPVIILPQTIGPFTHEKNFKIASDIIKKAKKVFVRDDKFAPELNKMGVNYELTKDLSAYMQPEPWDIDIKSHSVGINVSGLCYSNSFRALAGQFEFYPLLIDKIIKHFQEKNVDVYLIPHSYCFNAPEANNDDIVACKEAYNRLSNKEGVHLINKDLLSPQIKYVISKMSFFCGTRMHANFAAIYTGVPLFGLAYSYKFEGAFNANGLDGKKQTVMINNIKESDISSIIDKIELIYKSQVKE